MDLQGRNSQNWIWDIKEAKSNKKSCCLAICLNKHADSKPWAIERSFINVIENYRFYCDTDVSHCAPDYVMDTQGIQLLPNHVRFGHRKRMILYKPKLSSWLIDYDFSPVLSRHVYKVIYLHSRFTAYFFYQWFL